MPQKAKQGDRRCVDIGQQQTDRLARPGLPGKNPTQHLCPQHQPVIRDGLTGLVFQNDHGLAVLCGSLQQCLRQCQINGSLIPGSHNFWLFLIHMQRLYQRS